MRGYELEVSLRREMDKVGFVTGGGRYLDHERKTDIWVRRIDGKILNPPISIQVTLRVENPEKKRKFLESVAGQNERFLYLEIDDSGGFFTPDTKRIAGILRHLVKTQLQHIIWDKPIGYQISCLHLYSLTRLEDF